MPGNNDTTEFAFSPEEIAQINQSEEVGLVGLAILSYQSAVQTLTPEYWTGVSSDSIGHWWRRIGEKLSLVGGINDTAFWKEVEESRTSLTLEQGHEIATETKRYLSQLLQEVLAGGESPGRGTTLDAIYNPPLDELDFIAEMSSDEYPK